MVKNRCFHNFRHLTSTSTFRIFIILDILLAIYACIFITNQLSYSESVITVFSFPYCNMMLISLIFIIVCETIRLFKGNQFQLIRFLNKEEMFISMLKQVIFNVSIAFLFHLIFMFIGFNLFHFNELGFNLVVNGINIIIYNLFLIVRMYLYLIIISVINSLLLYILDLKFILGINIIILIMIPQYYFYFPTISVGSTNLIPIFISGFFTQTYFSNFSIELCSSIGYFFILMIFSYLLYYLLLKYNNRVV